MAQRVTRAREHEEGVPKAWLGESDRHPNVGSPAAGTPALRSQNMMLLCRCGIALRVRRDADSVFRRRRTM